MFKGEFNYNADVVPKVLLGLNLVGRAYKDQEDVVYESFPEKNWPDKGFLDGFIMVVHKEVGIWGDNFGSQGWVDQLENISTHEWKVVILQDDTK